MLFISPVEITFFDKPIIQRNLAIFPKHPSFFGFAYAESGGEKEKSRAACA